MSQSITWLGNTYNDVGFVSLPKTGSGNARFDDASVTTALAGDVASGKIFLAADGTPTEGTASGANLQAKTNINPSTSSQTIEPDDGFTGLSSVQINAMPSGTAGAPTASKGTVSNHSVTVTPSVTNTTGYITGGTKTGTGVSVAASELVSGTYTVDSSGTKDVTNYASASVSAGTAGTPTASKGTVSNHSVSVTPSVTNSTGWITGSTKTGTAVTVSASELVSGSETKTANGTYDVTNLAQLIVNVSGGGGSGLTLLGTASLGTISTSSTSSADTGKTVTATGATSYDLLVVITSCTKTNSRHWATIGLIELYNSSNATSPNTASISTNKYNFKVGSTGTVQSRCGTTAYGIYPNSCTFSSGNASIPLYQRYNSTSTGTINGSYTTKVYGIKLYDLL